MFSIKLSGKTVLLGDIIIIVKVPYFNNANNLKIQFRWKFKFNCSSKVKSRKHNTGLLFFYSMQIILNQTRSYPVVQNT